MYNVLKITAQILLFILKIILFILKGLITFLFAVLSIAKAKNYVWYIILLGCLLIGWLSTEIALKK